ncbi:hypothetical protein [Lysinibacillus varians]|uniref:Uncharacterized protein n=1 Tax=Lysinibacillus varians TaxID=1145276 RepID=A0ABY2T8L3_9BACI|nr:hypothetical protein [Lysinibacillus varians]AHN24473.1 hypothetical protein T479_19890 [Lysinibacillus varians]TKI60523.1 hypothetical protein FC752_15165 [Lysinibacillus varians]
MTKDEYYQIQQVVCFLEDSFWVLNKLKWEGHYNAIKDNEHYKRILEAIDLLENEHNALYELIKED